MNNTITIAKQQLTAAEGLTGIDQLFAIIALGQFLLGRGFIVLSDVQAHGALDDQGVLDAAKAHDAEAAEAWKALSNG